MWVSAPLRMRCLGEERCTRAPQGVCRAAGFKPTLENGNPRCLGQPL